MGGRHTLKPHPFCYLRGGALSLGLALSVVTPPPFGSLATSVLERSMGFAPPPRGGFAFVASLERRWSAIALVNYLTNLTNFEPSSL